MKYMDICNFYKSVLNSKKIDDDFMRELKTISSKDELKSFIEAKVCPIAESMGYDFTADDLLEYEIETVKRLSEEELESISGGAGVKHLILGGVVSLLTVGGSALLFGTAHAELNSTEVADSNSTLLTKVNTSVEVEVSREDTGATKEAVPLSASSDTTKEVVLASVASDTTKVSDASTKTQHTEVDDLKLVQASSGALDESLDADEFVVQAAESKQSETNKELRSLKDAQRLYVLQAANMQDPYVLIKSDVIKNFRLYGNISKIILLLDKNYRRKFVADEGDSVSNVMRMIFPSPAGDLSTEYGGVGEFSFSREPITSEMMAKLFAILNDYRNGKIMTDKTEESAKLKDLDARIRELDQKLSMTVNRVLHDEYFEEREKLESEKNEIKDHIYFDPSLKDIGANKSFLQFYGLDHELERIRKPIESLEAEEKEQKQISEELSKKIKELDGKLSLMVDSDELDDKIKEIDQKLSTTAAVVLYGEDLRRAKELVIERKKVQEKVKELSMRKKYLISYETNLLKFISMLMDATCMDSESWVENTRKKIQDALEHERQEYNKKKANVQKAKQKLKETDKKRLKNLESSLKAIEDSFEKKSKQLNAQLNQLQEYPKYLIEKILVSYLIKTLNTKEEIEKFYSELVKCLARNKSQGIIDSDGLKSEIDDEITRLAHLKEVVQVEKASANTPYKNKTYQNGSTTVMQFDKQSNKVIFASRSNTFQDCADTTVRHVVNLLSYSEEAKWKLLLQEADIEDLQKKLDVVVEAIGEEGQATVPFYDLQTRLQMFFLYQSKSERGADDCSQLARTLWEYAIFNMTEEYVGEYNQGKTKEEQMYAIIYRRNYELEPGYINMLKLMYNISLALPATRENSAQLKLAKTSIDELDELMGKENKQLTEVMGKVQVVMQDIFSLFCKDKFDVGIVASGIYKNDIFGSVKVTFRNEEFRITQSEGHAYVDHTPFEVVLPEKFYTPEYLQDDFAKLLLRVFNKKQQGLSNAFYRIFSGGSLSQDMNDDLYKKYKALRAFELLRGEENNRWRIENEITYDVLGGAKLISVNETKTSFEKGKQRNLLDVLYSRFLSKFEPTTREERRKRNVCLARPVEKEGMNGFSYIKINDDEAYLFIDSDVSDEEGNINIPSQIWDKDEKRELKVVRLGSLCDALNCQKLTFASGFKKLTIDSGAFENAKQLMGLQFNIDLEELLIGEEAFKGCSLTKLVIPKSVKSLMLDGTFDGCKTFETLAVENESQLESLIIKNGVFKESKITEFTVPTSVKSLMIGHEAFKGCGLTKLVIPKSVKSLTLDGTFDGCKTFETFEVEDESQLESLTIKNRAFKESKITEFTVPKSVKSLTIGHKAFYDCRAFTGFKIEEGTQLESMTIGSEAFNGCTAFKSLVMKTKNLTSLIIESEAFKNHGLEKFIIPSSVKNLEIKNMAFCDCAYLTDFIVEEESHMESLTIESGAFLRSGLTSFKVPRSVKSLVMERESFCGCRDLKDFSIEEGSQLTILKIDKEIFDKYLEHFTIGTGSKLESLTIESQAFYESGLIEFTIPRSVKSLVIGRRAFCYCKDFVSFSIEEGSQLTNLTIGEKAFGGTGLTGFMVPQSVKNLELGAHTFADCESLTDFTIETESQLKKLVIGFAVFSNSNLKRFIVPRSVEFLDIGNCAFVNFVQGDLVESELDEFIIEEDSMLEHLYLGETVFGENHLKEFIIPMNVKDLKLVDDTFEDFHGIVYVPEHLKEHFDKYLQSSSDTDDTDESDEPIADEREVDMWYVQDYDSEMRSEKAEVEYYKDAGDLKRLKDERRASESSDM